MKPTNHKVTTGISALLTDELDLYEVCLTTPVDHNTILSCSLKTKADIPCVQLPGVTTPEGIKEDNGVKFSEGYRLIKQTFKDKNRSWSSHAECNCCNNNDCIKSLL